MTSGTLTILEGSTFCICDEIGDVTGETGGLFADDTRFLARLRLTVNGKRPLLLSSGKVEYFSAAFFLRNPLAGGLGIDELSIERTRFVGQAMEDKLVFENQSMRRIEFDVDLEIGTDFADIMSVKAHDFALGDPLNAPPLPPVVAGDWDGDLDELLLADSDAGGARTRVVFSRPGEVEGKGVRYRLELDPRERWELRVGVFPSRNGDLEIEPRFAERHFGEELAHVRESLVAWRLRVPQLRASWDDLSRSFGQSVSDLAALRMRSGDSNGDAGIGKLPAAGMPWFMTVFGRDTIITCIQTLLFGPELARNALEVLAQLQAREDDPSIDAEPGKIVH